MLCEIDPSFINDESNLNGLKPWEKDEYYFDCDNSSRDQENERMIFDNALSIIEN